MAEEFDKSNDLELLKGDCVRLYDQAKIEITKIERKLIEMGDALEIKKPGKSYDSTSGSMRWSWEIITRESLETRRSHLAQAVSSLDLLVQNFDSNTEKIVANLEIIENNVILEVYEDRWEDNKPRKYDKTLISWRNWEMYSEDKRRASEKEVKAKKVEEDKLSLVSDSQVRYINSANDWISLANNAEVSSEAYSFALNQALYEFNRINNVDDFSEDARYKYLELVKSLRELGLLDDEA